MDLILKISFAVTGSHTTKFFLVIDNYFDHGLVPQFRSLDKISQDVDIILIPSSQALNNKSRNWLG